MRILDRYLVRSLLIPLAGGAFVFLAISIIVDVFERLDAFIDNEVETLTILKYYVSTIPYLFVLILPIATLIGVLFSLGGMARRSELVAMTASGLSLYRLLIPIFGVGVLISLVGVPFTTYLVPRGNYTSNDIYDHEIKDRPRITGTTRRDLNYLGQGGRYFLIRRYNGDVGEMTDVVVQQFADGTLIHRIDAKSVEWTGEDWLFRDGYIRRFRENAVAVAEPFVERRFPEIREQPQDFLEASREAEEMTLRELTEHIRRSELSGGDVTVLKVDWHTRFSFPFASLIVIVLGAPLAGAIRRGGHSLGFALALGIGFLYYVLFEFGKTLGHDGTFPPIVAAWLPNFVFLAVGSAGLWKTRK